MESKLIMQVKGLHHLVEISQACIRACQKRLKVSLFRNKQQRMLHRGETCERPRSNPHKWACRRRRPETNGRHYSCAPAGPAWSAPPERRDLHLLPIYGAAMLQTARPALEAKSQTTSARYSTANNGVVLERSGRNSADCGYCSDMETPRALSWLK